jgi:hypothetical protein
MRRFAASTYEDLQQRVTELFEISSFLLKYEDEDGDMVTVSSEWELEEALRCQGPVLKLHVEAAEDRQSGDFILVQKECVMHVQELEEVQNQAADEEPAPLAIPPSQSAEASPMALTPLPVKQPDPQCVRDPDREDRAERSQVHTKRTYTEATESKKPYVQGAHKIPTYIISVPAEGSNQRPTSKPHTVASAAGTPYAQGAKLRTPYAAGKQGNEFTKSPSVGAVPYGKGKASPQGFVLTADASAPYGTPAHAQVPFTQTI